MKTCISLLIPLTIFFISPSEAQDSLESNSTSHFKVGLSYLNDNVYMGRKDSVAIPYISPSIGYYSKSGFFITASVAYIPTESRMDNITIGGGYTFTKNNLDGELNVNKYYYSNESYNVRAEMKGDASANVTYDFGFIKPGIGGSLSFANKTDYAGNFSLEHGFSIFSDNGTVTPSFVINASTQNSYNAYYEKRKYAKTKKGKKIPYIVNANASDVSRFKILDYEAAVPLEYTVNKCTFTFIPTLAIPVNPNTIIYSATIRNTPGVITRTFQENIGPTFFWSIELCYKL